MPKLALLRPCLWCRYSHALVIVASQHPRKFLRLQIILEGQKAEMYFLNVGIFYGRSWNDCGLKVSLKLKLELTYQADFGEHVLSFVTSELHK